MATWLQVDNGKEFTAFNIESVGVAKIKGNTLMIWVNSIRPPFEITYKNKEQAEEAYNIIVKGGF